MSQSSYNDNNKNTCNNNNDDGSDNDNNNGSHRHSRPFFTQEQHESFLRNGYLFMKAEDLFHPNDIVDICEAANQACHLIQKFGSYFDFAETNMIYGLSLAPPAADTGNGEEKLSSDAAADADADRQEKARKVTKAFRNIAIHSKLAQACAELMQLDPETQTCRILRDVFLAKPVNKTEYCDWHVDDQGFWPESFVSVAASSQQQSGGDDDQKKDQNGINVWMALDDMPEQYEGSMAVATGSHKAEWRHEAYEAIGQDRARDPTRTLADVAEAITKPGRKFTTCGMNEANPELREKIEQSKVVFDLKRGDVIFATRLLYHRTLAVTEEGQEHYNSLGKGALNRYSIRYVPGSAKLPNSTMFGELSICWDPENAGKQLDEVVDSSFEQQHQKQEEKKTGGGGDGKSQWYPKVWPTLYTSIDSQLDDLFCHKVPTAKVRRAEARREFFSAIQAAKQKHAEGQQ